MRWFLRETQADLPKDRQSEIFENRVEQLTLAMAMHRRVPDSDDLPLGWFEEANANLVVWYTKNGGADNELWIYDLGCESGFALINGTRVIDIFESVERFPGGPMHSKKEIAPKPLPPSN